MKVSPRAGRKELESGWRSLRRGWYVGGEGFRKELLSRIDEPSSDGGQRPPPRIGPHDQSRAEEMLVWGPPFAAFATLACD